MKEPTCCSQRYSYLIWILGKFGQQWCRDAYLHPHCWYCSHNKRNRIQRSIFEGCESSSPHYYLCPAGYCGKGCPGNNERDINGISLPVTTCPPPPLLPLNWGQQDVFYPGLPLLNTFISPSSIALPHYINILHNFHPLSSMIIPSYYPLLHHFMMHRIL